MRSILRPDSRCSYFGRSFYSSWHNAKVLAHHSLAKYDEILADIREIECNLSARCRASIIDLSALQRLYTIYCKGVARKHCFKKSDECNPYELRQFESLDVCLKHLKTAVFSYLITLPNKLNERTPRGVEDTVIFNKCFPNVPISVDNHVLVGKKLKVLRYEDKATYYLENDAAKLELALVRFLHYVLKNERRFKPFRNPDTCNKFVLQGVVVDEVRKHAFHLLDSHQVLMGGASLASFCAVRVDTSTHEKFMPEHFFTCGRRYTPEVASSGLFGVCQRTDVSIFVASTSTQQMWREFDEQLRWMIELYERFGIDFRVCYTRAADLTLAECCRATVQLYSAHQKKFVDAARLSAYDTFVSQRLRILCHNAKCQTGLVRILDGIVVSVPSLIACLLERSTDRLHIPECVQPFMPK